MANLYLLTIKTGNVFYCVGNDPTEVQECLEKLLAIDGDSFSDKIKVTNINLVATAIHCFAKDKPVFSGNDNDLVIIKDWQYLIDPEYLKKNNYEI